MTGFADTRAAIEGRLAANWTTTPIKYPNVPLAEGRVPYVAIHVIDGDGSQASIGTTPWRRWIGVIILQIFTLPDTGTVLAKTYADTLAAIFERTQFSSGDSGTISCFIPSLETVGVKNGWFQVNVTVPFMRNRQY